VDKLFSLLSSNSNFLRQQAAHQIGEVCAGNKTNIATFLNKIRHDILQKADSVWDARLVTLSAPYLFRIGNKTIILSFSKIISNSSLVDVLLLWLFERYAKLVSQWKI